MAARRCTGSGHVGERAAVVLEPALEHAAPGSRGHARSAGARREPRGALQAGVPQARRCELVAEHRRIVHAGRPAFSLRPGGRLALRPGRAQVRLGATMARQTIELKIKRQDSPTSSSRWEEFSLPWLPNLNVISCLMEIRKHPVTKQGQRTTPVHWESSCLEE